MSTIILSPPPTRSKLRPGCTRGRVVPLRGLQIDHLLETAQQVEPRPIRDKAGRALLAEINRQGDDPAPADDHPAPDVWSPEMATYIGEQWLRRQLADLGHAS